MKVYYCKHCGNVVLSLVDKGPTPVCCGEKMELLNANSVDAATEKHVPEVIRDGETLVVKVGAVEHPMIETHLINWIAVESGDTVYVKHLHPGEKPEARFPALEHGTTYGYCNLHGLWKSEF